MPAPAITALPPAPSRLDEPGTFVGKADAFLGALADHGSEINAVAEWMEETAAQVAASAEAAEAAAGIGGTVWKLSAHGGLPGLPIDHTAIINTAIADLNAAGGGMLVFDGSAGTGYYVNGKLRQLSNVTLQGLGDGVPLIYGPLGMHEMRGNAGEDPVSRNIRAQCLEGTTTIYLGTGPADNHTNYVVGERIVLRGENDAYGAALFKDDVLVTAIDPVANTLTISEELENTYEVAYPSSPWPGDKTTIRKIIQSLMTAPPNVGDTTVTVGDGSKFAKGMQVLIQDDKIGTDVSGTSNNQIHMEANEVVDISGNVLTLAMPIAHPYELAFNAAVQVVVPVVNAYADNFTIQWAENSASNSKYAMSILYGRDCAITRCKGMGDPAAGLGLRGQGFRMGAGSYRCVIDEGAIHRPSFFGSGQGYGATIYKGARACTVKGSWFDGCRHSVLLFAGACDNLIEGNTSVDCRGTDYDLHGACEAGNRFINNKAIGGPSTTPDISTKAAFKIGNTTHRAGSFRTTISGNEVWDYTGHAFHVIPSSDDCVIKDNVIRSVTGAVLYLDRISTALTLPISNIVLIDNVVDRCTRLIATNGDSLTTQIYQGVTVTGNTCKRMTGTDVVIDPNWIADFVANDNQIEFAAATTGVYAIRLQNCPDAKVRRTVIDGGARGVRVVNCPGARISGIEAEDLTERVLLEDTGTSADLTFTDYVATGFDASFTSSSAGAVIAARTNAFAVARDALTRPTPIAGASNSVTFGSAEPAANTGTQLCQLSMKARTPRSQIAFQANVPAVVFSASDNAVALVFWSQNGGSTWTFGGAMTWRGTSGASSDTGAAISGAFSHTLTDLSTPLLVQLRLCQKTSTTDLTLADRFGANNRAVLTCREAA